MSIWRASFDEEADREQKEQKLNLRSNSFLNSILAKTVYVPFSRDLKESQNVGLSSGRWGKSRKLFHFQSRSEHAHNGFNLRLFTLFFVLSLFLFLLQNVGKSANSRRNNGSERFFPSISHLKVKSFISIVHFRGWTFGNFCLLKAPIFHLSHISLLSCHVQFEQARMNTLLVILTNVYSEPENASFLSRGIFRPKDHYL